MLPYAIEREPQELLPAIPPSVACAERADVDRKPHAVGPEPRVERVEHDARLHSDRHRLAIEREHAVQVPAVVDHERRANGLAALRTGAATREHRHAEFAADVEGGAHVVVRPRDQHADRLDLVDRRVGRIAAAGSAVEADLALHGAAQPPRQFVVAGAVE